MTLGVPEGTVKSPVDAWPTAVAALPGVRSDGDECAAADATSVPGRAAGRGHRLAEKSSPRFIRLSTRHRVGVAAALALVLAAAGVAGDPTPRDAARTTDRMNAAGTSDGSRR